LNSYHASYRNIGKHDIYVYDTFLGKSPFGCGILIAGSMADSFPYCDIPESVKIKWKKENGETVEREVRVKENLPKGFWNGSTMVFNINDKDEVILSFEVRSSKFQEIDSKGNEVDFNKNRNPDSAK
jgi:hypothetical protein